MIMARFPRQRKGLLTITLLTIAECISLAQAVTVWNAYKKYARQNNKREGTKTGQSIMSLFTMAASVQGGEQECLQTTGAGANQRCDSYNKATEATIEISSSPSQSIGARLFSRRYRMGATTGTAGQRTGHPPPRTRTTKECCEECSLCMNDRILAVCQKARGGHSTKTGRGVGDAVADAVLEAHQQAHGGGATPYNIPLNGWKMMFQVILTFINVACWLVPLKSKKISENKLALSLANSFSGGVFLSLAFGHLIPECVHGFANINEVLPYMLVLAGYLLIFFVEKVAFGAHDLFHEMEHGSKSSGGGASSNPKAHHHHNSHSSNDHESQSFSSKAPLVQNGVATGAPTLVPSTVGGGGGGGGRSAVILVVALAVHSILEMTALGLADNFGEAALLTLSIALHQPAESIALLVAFIKSGLSESEIIKYLSVFSTMGPIGVAIGMAVNEFAAPIVDAAMLALVAGTFVYVGATEVIPEEFEDSNHKWSKFFALMSGIVSIFVITQYTAGLEMK